MGSGKTSLAKSLAKEIGWQLFDTDSEIEKLTGKTVTEIFLNEGEAQFRQLESFVAKQLANTKETIISTGGGFPVQPDIQPLMKSLGFIVFLFASPEILLDRTKNSQRPMRKDPDNFLQVYIDRLHIYRGLSDIEVNTENSTIQQCTEKVLGYYCSSFPDVQFNRSKAL